MNNNVKSNMSLAVSRKKVRTIKDALEACDLLDRSVKITPLARGEVFSVPLKQPTGIDFQGKTESTEFLLSQLLSSIGESRCEGDVELLLDGPLPCDEPPGSLNLDDKMSNGTSRNRLSNPLEAAVDAWLRSIPSSMQTRSVKGDLQNPPTTNHKLPTPPTISGYTVYPPMLLLPPSAFSDFLGDDSLCNHIPRLYEDISTKFNVTHIALNAPIPALFLDDNANVPVSKEQPVTNLNTFRSPTGLTPLYGDFGPILPADRMATTSDFKFAFWCTAKQNGVFQTWAPRYTMFSRGNISEKVRILNLASSDGNLGPENTRDGYVAESSSAVDLYAGIGYFTFSYAKAGVAKVLCWEINPWSIEGLKRGARVNRWPTKAFQRHEDGNTVLQGASEENSRILIFEESNEYAMARLEAIRDSIPPIRHVNCGYLPSSKDSWKTAVATLDPRDRGWIHVHENIAKSDIETRKREILKVFNDLATEIYGPSNAVHRIVSCEHVERVKSYAPGVIHCVLDIAVTSVPNT